MPELMDHVAFLSQEIGPRPAGTEEEQQAALYITEQLQKDAGLSAVIEDFNSASNDETPRAVCCGVTFVFALASLFLPILAIPAMVLSAIAGILYVLESSGRPLVSRFLARGVSQNVVAKYEPGYSPDAGGARRRKVILVARYDSGKVRAELKRPFLGALPFFQWASAISMVLVPILLIVRNVFFLHAEGAVALVFLALIGLGLVFVALPLIIAIVHKFSSYNEAANANASGTAVLLDVARRVGRGRVSAAELAARAEAQGTVIHGEEEALAAGLVPEGAKLAYEASRVQPPEPAVQTPEDRLASAKAAIAALTGKPVPHSEPAKDIAANLVQVREHPIGQPSDDAVQEQRDETRDALTGSSFCDQHEDGGGARGDGAERVSSAPIDEHTAQEAVSASAAVGGFSAATTVGASGSGDAAVPDWFKKAQENAKKTREPQPGEIHRSRYADAFDAAVADAPSRFGQEDRAVDTDTEERLKKVREEIMGTNPVPEPVPAQESQGESPEDPAAGQWTSSVQDADPSQTNELASINRAEHPSHEDAVAQQPVSPESTTALPPIDVSDLRAQLAEEMDQMNAAAPKPAIVLPDIGKAPAALPSIYETAKQRAPLAEAEQSSQTAAKSLLTMLPTIGAEDIAAEQDGSEANVDSHGASESKPDLTILPSLSGEIRKPAEDRDEVSQTTATVSKAGSFASAGATGVFAPVGNELIENVAPDELYIDDADDSDYEGGVTETGAFAGPGYMEMPKSRVHRFFDRFSRKKKKNEEVSAQEWLDVDEEFEARSVGAARGGWESFQENGQYEASAYPEYDEYDEFDEFDNGPFEEGFDDGFDDGFEEDVLDDRERPWQGGAFSRRRAADQVEEADSFEPAESSLQPHSPVDDELEQIYQFRNPDVGVEVWFVALGSELAGNAGMKAFLAEHGTELRGSVIINIEGLGAGELSLIEKEGKYRRVAASSRMKRYMKKAGQATGLSSTTASVKWMESASSVALRHGFQAMSIAGMDGAKPAYFAQGDDVLENIEPDTLEQNADFVMELLKNI